MKRLVLGFIMAISVFSVNGLTDQSYYDVKWSDELIDEFQRLGYNPKELSKIMYMSNDKCSKRVLDIDTNKAKICVAYKCGFFTSYINIDKYLETVKVSVSSDCRWYK